MRCPNCLSDAVQPFYETGPVPVHSCLMLDEEAAARAFPRRPIRLGACDACGFVTNMVFDPQVHDYCSSYEDQQSFSRRFCRFQTELVRALIDCYDVRGKNIVEIGCGKGDFLVELCRTGGNRGIGIDPRSNPDSSDRDAGIRFVPEYYSRKHWDIAVDLVACRHTLEHLPDTDRFVAELRQALDLNPHALVFFEVPDATRIFRECAFWDIYYEHCSYFSPEALATLFRRNRFEVLEVSRVFEDQYLTLVAHPQAGAGSQAGRDSQGAWKQTITDFSTQVSRTIEHWRSRLAERAGQRLAVWGAGSKCVSFLSTLDCEQSVSVIVDINPHQQGRFLPGSGKRIVSPEALSTVRPDAVLIMNPVYRDEIARQLEEMGLQPELIRV